MMSPVVDLWNSQPKTESVHLPKMHWDKSLERIYQCIPETTNRNKPKMALLAYLVMPWPLIIWPFDPN